MNATYGMDLLLALDGMNYVAFIFFLFSSPEDKKTFLTVTGEWNGQMFAKYADREVIKERGQYPLLSLSLLA